MNEAEIQNTPVEDGANEIDALFDKGFDQEVNGEISSEEETSQPTEEEVVQPDETKAEEQVDYTPFLTKISEVAKYNHEPVKVESFDDVITNFQKGLNYPKLEEKIAELENSEEKSLIKEIADEYGVTTKEAISLIRQGRENQKIQQEQEQYDALVENGMTEEYAKMFIENNKKVAQLEKESNLRKLEQQKQQETIKKQEEYENFFKEFPDVKAEDIPADVFEDGKKIGLTNAYTKFQNKELQKQIQILKQNQENKIKAPVSGVTEHGGVVNERPDTFDKGWNS
jgi:hypothetical protein